MIDKVKLISNDGYSFKLLSFPLLQLGEFLFEFRLLRFVDLVCDLGFFDGGSQFSLFEANFLFRKFPKISYKRTLIRRAYS